MYIYVCTWAKFSQIDILALTPVWGQLQSIAAIKYLPNIRVHVGA